MTRNVPGQPARRSCFCSLVVSGWWLVIGGWFKIHASRAEVDRRTTGHQPPAYSYLRLSTGSSLAALAAGTVPNRIPTRDETTMATMADKPEIGILYSVRKRTE